MPTNRDALLYFVQRGYRVGPDGVAVNGAGRPVALNPDADGYLRFATRARNHPVHGSWEVKCHVHRLMAYQKFGDRIFEPGQQVRHLDGNLLNNSESNIGIGTASDNMMDIPPARRVSRARHAGRHNAKLSDSQVAEIRASKMTLREIMAKYGISKAGASYVRRGKTYAASA